MSTATRLERAAGRPAIAERLRALLARRANGEEGAALATFARLLVAKGGPHLASLADEETAALVASAFRFYAAPGPELRVRALTPTYATEGWDAPTSVIETCMPDRPFIIDTIRERLTAEGIGIRELLHPIFAARRDPTGRLESLSTPEGLERRESFTHIALERVADPVTLARLEADIRAALEDVRLVTDDFPAMAARAHAIAGELDAFGRASAAAEAGGVAACLRWLVDGGFVFLGYREYALGTDAAGASVLYLRPGTGLGLLRREERSAFAVPRRTDELPEVVRARLFGGRLLTVAKTLAESPVHRRVRMDDIGVRELDADGRVIGERRFIGLLTSKTYAEEAAEMPLLRRMLQEILAAEEVVPGSHDHKELVAVFNTLPKSELFASTPAEIHAELKTILDAARRREIAVAVRASPGTGRVFVVVVMPRERFSSEAQRRIAEVVVERLGGILLDDHLALGEAEWATLHFALAAPPPKTPIEPALAAAVVEIVQSWEERLARVLRSSGPDGERLAARFARAFPAEYRARVPVEQAADDVLLLDAADRTGNAEVAFRNDADRPATSALHVYLRGEPLILSECVPMFENLGLRALAEDQVVIEPAGGPPLYLHTFLVQDRQGRRLDVETAGQRLVAALLALRAGRAENDVLNRLVLEAGLDWRAVECLRTYCGYAVQAGLAARPAALAVLAAYPEPARLLFECFAARFGPPPPTGDGASLREGFLASLEGVQVLREDLLLRALLDVVEATVRTNFYAEPARPYVAIKIRAADLSHLQRPRPLYEIYVHSPTMEGVHLRAGKIARGGIRHSDRQDFRTEILGLMKTQTVKNAVIVPVGAKGGFVLKGAAEGRRDRETVLAAYRTLIRGLLDLTDNLAGGRVVHPVGLRVHDEEDPYLVVAADKGTATFSDVANALAAQYGFWLGDAFASGGSRGYDHKALGITARGAWESVRTHFRELGIDADTAPLTVAGIGDMSGDVFGNGLLRSPHLRLRAAFNHLHVFLDPDPDPARSFAERSRLFRAGQGWDSYDPMVLSRGGTVVPRAAKRVVVSPEVQAMLGLSESAVSGERLIQAVLTLDADLFFNGGVGTYVAASGEADADIRDTVNDPVRVRASALRARVVAEGGNLGFTERARIEYALAGGRINTDAVDNSAGVDLSDHEVNLKICLRGALESGALAPAARDALLAGSTTEVAASVLAHNRAQSRLLGLDQLRSRTRLVDFRELIGDLERSTGLDRVREALPDSDALRVRRGIFLGLTRPELAVLMAYTKIHLQRAILASTLPADPIVEPALLGYFPTAVREGYPEAVRAHPLGREIIATELANTLVDNLGGTFVSRVSRDTGVSAAEVVRAWAIAWSVADGASLARAVDDGNYPVEAEMTSRLVLERTIERVTTWILANTDGGRTAASVASELGPAVARVRPRIPEWLAGAEAESLQKLRSELEIAGLSASHAGELATAEWLVGALDVVRVAGAEHVDPEAAAACYYALGEHIDFAWLWARLAEAGEEEDRWQRRAVAGLAEDLLRARRSLARAGLRGPRGGLPARGLATLQQLIRDLRAAPRTSLAALDVVVREIRRLAMEALPEVGG